MQMKKLSHLVIAALAVFTPSAAHCADTGITLENSNQTEYIPGHEGWKMYDPFDIAITIGGNINTGGKMNAEWFGTRRDIAPQFNYRFTGFVSKHWGIYGDLGLTIYKTDGGFKSGVITDIAEAFADALFLGISNWHFSLGVGGAYRYATGRMQFIPRAGLNFRTPGNKTHKKSSGSTSWSTKCQTPWLCADTGIECGYRLSRLCSLILDVDYSLPLQQSKFRYTKESPSENKTECYKSHSWGNELTVSLGIKISMGK